MDLCKLGLKHLNYKHIRDVRNSLKMHIQRRDINERFYQKLFTVYGYVMIAYSQNDLFNHYMSYLKDNDIEYNMCVASGKVIREKYHINTIDGKPYRDRDTLYTIEILNKERLRNKLFE